MDADAVIKLNKAGVLPQVLDSFDCVIPTAVFEEVVTQGKLHAHDDAAVIESILAGGVQIVESDSKMPGELGLGAGESAVRALFRQYEDAIVVSDDRRFLSVHGIDGTPFVTPVDVLLLMARQGVLRPKDARTALDALKPAIRPAAYWESVDMLDSIKEIENEED